MTYKELQAEAKKYGIKYVGVKKADLEKQLADYFANDMEEDIPQMPEPKKEDVTEFKMPSKVGKINIRSFSQNIWQGDKNGQRFVMIEKSPIKDKDLWSVMFENSTTRGVTFEQMKDILKRNSK